MAQLAVGTATGRGTHHLVRFLADMPDNQAASLIAIESLRQRTSATLGGFWITICASKHAGGQTAG